MAYIEPEGEILNARREGDTSLVIVQFDRMDPGPVAPAGLYIDPKSGEERFPLHRVIQQECLVFHFETYNCLRTLPEIGESFRYRGWWLQEAMEAALDVDATWEYREYPNDGTHQHCLFTWRTLGDGGDRSGWWAKKYGWICDQAHRDFIVQDVYRLRRQSHA